MKKILFFMTLATALFSCTKYEEIYRGDSKKFNYRPSYLVPVMLTPPVNGIAVISVGGRPITVQCVTPTNPVGDVIIVDAPVIPETWDWYNNNGVGEYRPAGIAYPAGFSTTYCTGYYVEIFSGGLWAFRNGVSLQWYRSPNPADLVGSFRYPEERVNPVNLPYVKRVVRTSPNSIGVEW